MLERLRRVTYESRVFVIETHRILVELGVLIWCKSLFSSNRTAGITLVESVGPAVGNVGLVGSWFLVAVVVSHSNLLHKSNRGHDHGYSRKDSTAPAVVVYSVPLDTGSYMLSVDAGQTLHDGFSEECPHIQGGTARSISSSPPPDGCCW